MAIFTNGLSPDDYEISAIEATIYPIGDEGGFELGDLNTAAVAAEIEEIQRDANINGVRVTVRRDIIMKGGTLTLEGLQMSDDIMKILDLSAIDIPYVRPASTGKTLTIGSVGKPARKNRTYRTGSTDITNVECEGLTIGVDFDVDGPSGQIKLYVDEDPTYEFTYDEAAVLESAGRRERAPWSGSGTLCLVVFRGTNMVGKRRLYTWNRVRFRPDGDRQFHGDAGDYATWTITGALEFDPSKGKDYGFARAIDLD